jgi:hypothetical protein
VAMCHVVQGTHDCFLFPDNTAPDSMVDLDPRAGVCVSPVSSLYLALHSQTPLTTVLVVPLRYVAY